MLQPSGRAAGFLALPSFPLRMSPIFCVADALAAVLRILVCWFPAFSVHDTFRPNIRGFYKSIHETPLEAQQGFHLTVFAFWTMFPTCQVVRLHRRCMDTNIGLHIHHIIHGDKVLI